MQTGRPLSINYVLMIPSNDGIHAYTGIIWKSKLLGSNFKNRYNVLRGRRSEGGMIASRWNSAIVRSIVRRQRYH